VIGVESWCRNFKIRSGAVSPYKFTTEPELSHGTKGLIGSRCAVRLQTNQFTVKVPEAKAKTITSLLIIPSVLGLLSITYLSSRICRLDDFVLQDLAS
jgi:hypothetical protein